MNTITRRNALAVPVTLPLLPVLLPAVRPLISHWCCPKRCSSSASWCGTILPQLMVRIAPLLGPSLRRAP